MMMQPERDDTMDTTDATRPTDTTSDAPTSTADLAAARTERRDGTTTDMPAAPVGDNARRPLLGDDELSGYRSRWDTVQVRFVDEPRDSVKQADGLVADLMQRLAQTFAEERASLEGQWEQGTDVSTEDLRIAMQRYRSFFDRLLSA
jgi:hypothetical protein